MISFVKLDLNIREQLVANAILQNLGSIAFSQQ